MKDSFYFVHGFMGHPEEFQLFSESNSLFLPGHEYTLARDWSTVGEAMWSQVKEEKISLFGYSMGGRIALSMLDIYPHRVKSLILCSAQFKPPDDASSRIVVDTQRARDLREDPENFLKWWTTLELFGPQHAPSWEPIFNARILRSKDQASSWADVLQSLSVSIQPDYSTLLKTHSEKTTFIYGEHDIKYSKFADDYRKLNVPTIRIPDAWHSPHLDNPMGLSKAIERLKT